MSKSKVQIFEQDLQSKDGKIIGKVTIFKCDVDVHNPIEVLDKAVKRYTSGIEHYQYIDYDLSNSWYRVVTSNIDKLDYIPIESSEQYNRKKEI